MKLPVSRLRRLGSIVLLLPLIFAIAVAAYSWQVNRELARDYQDVTHAYAVTRALESLMGRVTDGETAEHGFLMTGDDVYLEPYILFTSTIDQLYATLGGLLAGEPAQQPRMALLRTSNC
jgi:CHASE3 domain sensor protein